ncbi:unnamed protein product [Cladocopium goreaui]|uniref:Endonuclease/exonuclease/phosphatase domain-containing protein n=1 Tax=Cladocopium goreaui TaxID=2562237 RepID=A0A9P1GLQ3_9DINO|nr:unnamed protein product [Cladocopium goreaui]
MRFLTIFSAFAAAERSAPGILVVQRISQEFEATSHRHVDLAGENATLVLATQADLLDMQKVMLQHIEKVNLELQETIKSTFKALDETVASEVQQMQDRAQFYLEQTYAMLYTLQVSEWRLQMAARHGTHGRCCCQATSMSSCEWVDHWLLVGHERICPAHVGKDYLDHFTDRMKAKAQNELTEDQVAPLNRLVDSCRESPAWQEQVEGRQDRLVEAVPTDALQAIKDIAVWQTSDSDRLPGIIVENMSP